MYDHITQAAVEMAYDVGGINRDMPEARYREAVTSYLPTTDFHATQLDRVNRWLGSLSEDDLNTVCAGEESEAAALMKNAPPETELLLNDLFEMEVPGQYAATANS